MKKKEFHPELDALLKSESQQAIRQVVKAVPEDELSLAWRSGLNERLRQIRPQPRWRTTIGRTWKPVVGLALAGCLALAITFKPGMSDAPVSRGNLEASLVNAYNDSANVEDLVGAGLSVREVGDTTLKSDSSSQWTEADLSYL